MATHAGQSEDSSAFEFDTPLDYGCNNNGNELEKEKLINILSMLFSKR